MSRKKKNEDFEEFVDTSGLITQEEIDAINEYRRTGKIPEMPYEELDFNNVGGILPDNDEED